uniref:Uncharacterized protein n=1 Tax=Pseudomonas migulae TaxID=78543 RepID=R4ITU8_9PSED|nr:hypothetical protein [Pseudomonas migulae]AGC70363.1 hypothetical protein pD2RT_009 [Pseudomonas migulae]
MRLMTPDAEDKREMAGRMYEICDLKIAIESGHFSSLEDVLSYATEQTKELQAVLEVPQWIVNDRCCVDIKATIEQVKPGPDSHQPGPTRRWY